MRRLALLVLAACSHRADPAPAPPRDAAPAPASTSEVTPRQFLSQGKPTFVTGTLGDDLSDRAVAVQAAMIADRLGNAPLIDDHTVVQSGWPAHAVVYGGPAINAAVAAIAPDLPFQLTAGHLAIGGQTFDGDDIRLITVVPATAHAPSFLLYAGAGTPGIGEINAVTHIDAAITVADRFGVLCTGTWGPSGAVLGPRTRRVEWRTISRDVSGTRVDVHVVASLAPAPDEAAQVDAVAAGVDTSQTALGLTAQPPLDVYLYPDRASKAELTGNSDDGTAVVEARTFHARAAAPDLLMHLIAHEATHLLAYKTWGPAGNTLLGEGLAVWASGQYAGMTIDQWKATLAQHPTIADALARGRAIPERVLYPLGALVVRVIVAKLGAPALRDHLLAATASTWADACRAAGTTPDALEAALDAEIAR